MLEEFRDGQTWFNLTWLKEKERYSIESLSRDGVLAFVSEICRPDAEPAP